VLRAIAPLCNSLFSSYKENTPVALCALSRVPGTPSWGEVVIVRNYNFNQPKEEEECAAERCNEREKRMIASGVNAARGEPKEVCI